MTQLLTPEDPQVASIRLLCSQIEGIASMAGVGLPQDSGALSYSPGIFTGPREAFAELAATVQTLLMKLKPVAIVQTTADGEFAETVIEYAWGATSVTSGNVPAELERLHLGSLQRTFALRSAVASALAAAGSAMVALSASVANPLAMLHVLSTARSLKEALQRLVSAVEAAA